MSTLRNAAQNGTDLYFHHNDWLGTERTRTAPQVFSVDNVASWSYIVIMKSVGLRELKNRLSEYVREVRSGEGVLVTDRGEVVAELLPPGQGLDESGVPYGLMALAKRGQLTLGASNEATLYRKLTPLLKRHRAAALLDEERGTR